MTWIRHFSPKPAQVFVNHGEDNVCEIFAGRLRNELGIRATRAPYNGAVYDLMTGQCLEQGNMVKNSEEDFRCFRTQHESGLQGTDYRPGDLLKTVIDHNEGGANKDLRAFTKELLALCQKWDR